MSLSKSKVFLVICIGFIAGIFLGRWLGLKIMAVMAMIFVALSSLGWRSRPVRLAGLLGLVILLGAFRYQWATTGEEGRDWGKVDFSGTVCEEPDARPDKTLLTLCKVTVREKAVSYKLLATVARFPEYSYGDRVSGSGKLQQPKDGAAGEFSYKDYLSRYGIMNVVYYPKLAKAGDGGGNAIKGKLLQFKQAFLMRISGILAEPENAFLAGLLVGAKRGIPEDLMQSFSDTGTTHIIAISGFNITIIAWALDKLLRRLGRRTSFFLSLLCIGLFVVLTGASASVVRAGIMGSLGLVALNIGRVYAITNALVFAAVIMLGFNPKLLMFDVGFQLSFLSLMGLVYLSPIIESYFSKIPKAIRVFLVATLSAQIFTLPILLYDFDRLSLVSPIANVLVLPLIPPAMLTGFTTGALALIYPPLALPAAWATWFLLAVIIKIVSVLSALPFAAVSASIPAWFVIVYYAILGAWLWALKHPTIFDRIRIWKKQPSA